MTMLFKMASGQNVLKMFGRKRNNSGMIWATLLGLGVSMAAYGFGKNTKKSSNTNKAANTAKTSMSPIIQNFLNNVRTQNRTQMPKMSTLTELSTELLADKEALTNPSQPDNQKDTANLSSDNQEAAANLSQSDKEIMSELSTKLMADKETVAKK
jgi:hypothetical protein